LYSKKKKRVNERAIADVANTKPGFLEFYRRYKKATTDEENERAMALLAGIVGIVVGGVAAGVSAGVKAMANDIARDIHGTPRDVEMAIRSLERTIAEKK
jgi:hypothetical protein